MVFVMLVMRKYFRLIGTQHIDYRLRNFCNSVSDIEELNFFHIIYE